MSEKVYEYKQEVDTMGDIFAIMLAAQAGVLKEGDTASFIGKGVGMICINGEKKYKVLWDREDFKGLILLEENKDENNK